MTSVCNCGSDAEHVLYLIRNLAWDCSSNFKDSCCCYALLCKINIHSHSPLPSPPQTDQGIKCILPDKAAVVAGTDPDYSIRDLYNAIATGNYVSMVYSVCVCVCMCVCVCVCQSSLCPSSVPHSHPGHCTSRS